MGVVREGGLHEVDAVVRLLDAAVGKVLEAQPQVVAAALVERYARADVVAELEGAAEMAVLVQGGRGDDVKADGALHVGRDCREAGLLDPEYRREPEVADAALVRSAPLADLRFPVAAEMPVADLQPLLLPVPRHADAPHRRALADAFAELEGGAVAREGSGVGCIARIRRDGAESKKRNRCGQVPVHSIIIIPRWLNTFTRCGGAARRRRPRATTRRKPRAS